MKGVPLRLDIGPKDLLEGTITLFRRDLNTKSKVYSADLFDEIKKIKEEFTSNLKEQAHNFFEESIITVNTYDDLKEVLKENKMVRLPFCSTDMDGVPCAEELKADTKGAEVLGTRMDYSDKPEEDAVCIVCGKKAKEMVYVGKPW